MTVHALAGAYRRGRVEASRRWVIHGVLPKWYMRNRTGQFAYRGRHRLLCLVSSGGPACCRIRPGSLLRKERKHRAGRTLESSRAARVSVKVPSDNGKRPSRKPSDGRRNLLIYLWIPPIRRSIARSSVRLHTAEVKSGMSGGSWRSSP